MTHEKMETNIIKSGLTKVIKRPPIDIQFENISYSAGGKPILNAVSGKFRSGKLIGILGSSGAGKTTLLNILAGHLQNGVSGKIYINDELRVMKIFHKMICYITQEDVVQPYLTVMESIQIAASLKLNDRFSEMDKELVIEDVLSAMGLTTCTDTRVENLSGGQRKRLIIALEFISNPQIIFLDEPTTGLDDFALRNCIHLLKSCALQGRTIVCTIHQPSDSVLKLFDSIYVMASGNCIYNGTVPDLVGFLSSCGFVCPTNYNPADYIIEISHFDYFGMLKLKDKICNGKTYFSENEKSILSNEKFHSDENDDYSYKSDFSTSFWRQFSVLTKRKFLQMKRNKLSIVIAFGVNVIIGGLLGLLFHQVGMKGSRMQANVKYFYCIVMHFLFTYFMVPILLYPFEIKLLEREYFNRWYSLKAYYLSSCISILPVLISSTAVFVILVYTLTGQPLEWNRFLWFTLICMLTGIASQRLGYVIGTLFNPTEGATVGSILISFLILISIYNVGHGNMTSTHMNILSALSFPYHAFVGIGTSVLEHRGTLDCDEIVCYFGDSDFVMQIMGWEGKTTALQAFYLLLFAIFHQILSYLSLKIRVAPNLAYIRNLILSFKL